MTWYKSQVSYLNSDESVTPSAEQAAEKLSIGYSSYDEGVFEPDNQNGDYTSSEEEELHHPQIITNNNNSEITKASIASMDNDSMSLSSNETEMVCQ